MLEKNKELLEKIAVYYIAQLKADLKSEGHYATGRLEKSIEYSVKNNEIDFWSNYTNELSLLGLSEGRKKSDKKAGRLMIDHVKDWMKAKGIQPRKGKGKGGGRFKKRSSDMDMTRAAFAMATGIIRKGYEGSGTIERSYRKLELRIDADILEAYKKHLEEEVNKITLK